LYETIGGDEVRGVRGVGGGADSGALPKFQAA